MFLVISAKLYIVLSAYKFNSSNVLVTSESLVPACAVFVNIVCIEPILVSYSWKPVITGSIVKAFAVFLAESIALFVMFTNAVVPITPSVENFCVIVSTPDARLSIPFLFKVFTLLLILSSPSTLDFILSFSLSFCKVPKVLLTPLSKPWLLNSIWTIRLSIELTS